MATNDNSASFSKTTNPREHLVRPLDSQDAAPQQERKPPVPTCPTHPDQPLCFLCKNCDAPVCLYCKMTSHQSHVTEDMASAVLPAKERLRDLVARAREQISVLEASIRRLSRDERELGRQKQEVTQELNARYDEILRWVNRSRGELLESVEAKAEAAEAQLKAEGTRAMDALGELSKLAWGFSKIPDTSPEVWTLERDLKASLLQDDAVLHFRQLADAQDRKSFLRLTSEPSVLDLGMVRAFMGELDASCKASPSLSLSAQVAQAREHTKDLETRLKTTEQNLLQVLQALQAKQDSADSKLQAAETRLDTVQRRVAFHAWHSTNPLRVAGYGPLVMNHAPVNVGNGYDTSTGQFTAPVGGLYCFQGTVMAYKGAVKKVYATLFVNDQVHGLMVSDSQHNMWDQATVQAVAVLQQGQRACLKNTLDTLAEYYSDTGQPYTSFSGYLLQAD